jgi:phage N-6-adenine-methyltransferase
MGIGSVINSKWGSNTGNQYWQTPIYFFDILARNFNIKLDAATTIDNPLRTELFYTENDNGLNQPWHTWTYCNPPYSETELWVKKAYWEQKKRGIGSLLLIPANVDTRWFHTYIWNRYKDEPQRDIYVKIIYKRIKFVNARDPAKFSNMLVVFADDLYRNRYINLEPPTNT